MEYKKEIMYSGGTSNTYSYQKTARILGYSKTLVVLHNRGTGSGLVYTVEATPDLEVSNAPWKILLSGTVLLSGDVNVHKLTDPWDGIRIKTANLQSNFSCNVTIWVNRDAR